MGIFQYNNKVEELDSEIGTPPSKGEEVAKNNENEVKDVKIEFKGSLSSVYTQALNEAYALESTDGVIPTTTKDDEEKSIIVYTVKDDELNNVQKVMKDIQDIIIESNENCMLIGLENVDSDQSKLFRSHLEKNLKVKVLVGLEETIRGVLELKKKG